MVTDIKGSILAHATRENVKLEMLDVFMEFAGKEGVTFTNKQKDFILDRTDALVDMYDVSVKYRKMNIQDASGGVIHEVVVEDDVSRIVKLFRVSIAKMIFHIIRLDLANKFH